MYTKQDLAASLTKDTEVIKHLFDKIPADTFGYKPTEGQRTTLELLQYMSIMTPAAIDVVYQGDSAVFNKYTDVAKTVTAENFKEKIDEHLTLALTTLEKFTDKDLNTTIDIFMMGPKSKGVYLVDTILKWLVAYKMQLFLYIKASGNSSIGTSNVWGGFDMPVR